MVDRNRLHFRLDSSAAASVDAYTEYTRIVGDDDGGKLFTPDEYEAYKKKVAPMRINNRIYVSLACSKSGIECKMIGPETKCFCQHRYKQHQSDFKVLPDERPIKLPCNVAGCACRSYHYVPSNGSQAVRCKCKHTSEEHSVVKPRKCKQCSKCSGFHSPFTCGCGFPIYDHHMLVETRSEREARGKPIGQPCLYKAMGGLTGFSSLAEGHMRLDPSGIGAPPVSFLEQPPGPYDHPFLKAHSGVRNLRLAESGSSSGGSGSGSKGMTKEEQDMAYFEKRYQQRLKAEREASRSKHSLKK